jgi:OmpA-OmpF porin, OOP family
MNMIRATTFLSEKAYLFPLIILLFICFPNKGKAQLSSTPWIFGVGTNFIDNDQKTYEFLNIGEWYYSYYPSFLSVEKKLAAGISLEVIGTYNEGRHVTIVEKNTTTTIRPYYGLDGIIKYDLNEVFGPTSIFDPFVHIGYGYHYLGPKPIQPGKDFRQNTSVSGVSHNIGFGFNLWFTPTMGLNLQTMGKWVNNKRASNHIQHSAAFIYKIGEDKKTKASFMKKRYRSYKMRF